MSKVVMLGKFLRKIFSEDKENEGPNKIRAIVIFILCFVFFPIIIGVLGSCAG